MIMMTEETRSGWCVVGARGRADAEAADELEAALRRAVESSSKVAADFSALSYISSAGLRAVIQAARAAQSAKVEFVICSLTEPVRKVFDLSGLHQLLRVQGELPC
jgi:anti-sigma B factor antagonist